MKSLLHYLSSLVSLKALQPIYRSRIYLIKRTIRTSIRARNAFILFIVSILLFGCVSDDEPALDIYFGRKGIVIESPDIRDISNIQISNNQGRAASWNHRKKNGEGSLKLNKMRLLPFLWTPQDIFHIELTIKGKGFVKEAAAPMRPSPVAIARVPLEDVRPVSIDNPSLPDTITRFSKDGRYLAIGSFNGYLRVAETWTGKVIYSKKIAEGMVKHIDWGKIGPIDVIYVGEQSPDGYLYCLNAFTGDEIWRYRLADKLDTSRPSRENDRSSIYNFPGTYRLRVLLDGDLVIVGTHGWYRGNEYIYKCQAFRFDGKTGEIKWQWPHEGPMPYSLVWMDISQNGDKVILMTSSRKSTVKYAKNIPGYKNSTVYCLNGRNGKVLWEYPIPPLTPYYEEATAWQGISISEDGRFAVLGLNDGRGMLFDTDTYKPVKGKRFMENSPLWIRDIGTPILIGDIPVAAHISYAAIGDGEVYFVLPGTSIPLGTTSGKVEKTAPHPSAYHIFAYDLKGRLKWKWRADGSMQGVFVSTDGRWVVTVNSYDRNIRYTDAFGINVFDTQREADRLAYVYPTEGPVFFMAHISNDGKWIAFTEAPFIDNDKKVKGRYQVHIVH